MICIDEAQILLLQNNLDLRYNLALISTELLLGEGSPYFILEETFLEEDSTVAEHLMDDLDIPLVDIYFHPTKQ